MKHLNKLISRYKNRADRIESDCAVLHDVFSCLESHPGKKVWKNGVRWLCVILAHPKTNPIAYNKVKTFLTTHLHDLSAKRQKKLKKIFAKREKKTKRSLLAK